MIVGAMLTGDSLLALATVFGVVVAALVVRDLVLLGVGAMGAFVNLPAAVARWFPDSVAAPVALVATGLLLVVGAVALATRGAVRGGRDSRGRAHPSG